MGQRSVLTGAGLGLLAFGLFAVYDISVKFLGGGYHPLQIMAAALFMAMPLVLAFVMLDKEPGPLRPRHPWWMLLRVVITTLNGMLGVTAFAMLPLAETYLIFFTMPLFIAVLAVPLLGERIDPVRGLAVLIGLIGVLVALNPATTSLSVGHGAALAGSLTGAVNYVIIRRMGGVERTAVLLVWPMLGQALVLGGVMAFVWVPMPLHDLAVALMMALAMCTGMLLIIAAYRRAPAIVVAPMQYSQILWAAIFGALLFDEAIRPATLAGTVLIVLAGVAVVARREAPPALPSAPGTARP